MITGFISIVIAMFCYQTLYVDTLSIEINGNVSGILGKNGTEIECSYTKENVREISRVDILAFNKSSVAFEQVAGYLPDKFSTLLSEGQYLKGRVTLINITQSSTKAVMIFNKLMCIDGTFYKCRVRYTDSSYVDHEVFSSNTSIQVQDVDSLSVEINGNVSGILGKNGTEIECSYTKENVREISRVDILAFNKSSVAFEQVAGYLPDKFSTLLPEGQYLKGRVTLTSITQSSTKAVMIFNKLMCIDGTFYKCRVRYTDSSYVDHEVFSSNTSIQVQGEQWFINATN